MCGRFTLRTPLNQLVERFLFEMPGELWKPRFNIAPSQPVAALRRPDPETGRQLAWLRWGLIPSWAKDPAVGYKMINARSETVAEKPSFRHAFKHRRCLVLADGYYEWKKGETTKQKQPYYIGMLDEQPFAFAGLWESWRSPDGSPLETCTIITTEANSLTRSIHPRMPVILDPEDYDRWLATSEAMGPEIDACLRRFPSERMTMFPVSTLVNSPKNDSPGCIEPLDDSDEDDTRPRQIGLT